MISVSPQFNPTPIDLAATTDSVYAQVRGEVVRGLTLSGGVRYDHHDTFGGHTVGQASLAWRPTGIRPGA